jgi:hypothetical protein
MGMAHASCFPFVLAAFRVAVSGCTAIQGWSVTATEFITHTRIKSPAASIARGRAPTIVQPFNFSLSRERGQPTG